MGKQPKLKPPKTKKRKARKQPEFTANMSRSDRIMLVLAWARHAEAVMIGGVVYPCRDGWVDSWLLGHRTIGGASALRRLRELRALPKSGLGGLIERRERDDAGDLVVEYRFVER